MGGLERLELSGLCHDCASQRDSTLLSDHVQLLRERGVSPEHAALALASSLREGRAYDHEGFLTPRATAIVRELSRPEVWVDAEPNVPALLRARLKNRFVGHPALTAVLYDEKRMFRRVRAQIEFNGLVRKFSDHEGTQWLDVWSDEDWSYRGVSAGTIVGNEIRMNAGSWPELLRARETKRPLEPSNLLRRLGWNDAAIF